MMSRWFIALGLALAWSTFWRVDARAAAPVFKVGSFTNPATASGPVTHTVTHGLGVTPKAIIIFGTGGYGSGSGFHVTHALGASTLNENGAVGHASQSNQADSNASMELSTSRAVLMSVWGEVRYIGGAITGWNSSTFTITFTECTADEQVTFHYIVLGGSGVSAKIVDWSMPTTTGLHSVTGVGFRPNVVFHFWAADTLTTANAPTAGGSSGIGAINLAGSQWSNALWEQDAAATTAAYRVQDNTATLVTLNGSTVRKRAAFSSMDSDGFTLNFTTNAGTHATKVFSLALAGVDAALGSFTKSTSSGSASQSVPGLGLTQTPGVILTTSTNTTATTSVQTHARRSVGAAASTSTSDQHAVHGSSQHNSATSNSARIESSSSFFIKSDAVPTAYATEASGTLTALSSSAFTVGWTTNDTAATQILYAALASPSATVARMAKMEAHTTGAGTEVTWRTSYESDVLGFHVHRGEEAGRSRVSSVLIPGSALLASGATLLQGRPYSFVDRSPWSAVAPMYWIEEINLDGSTVFHGPVSPSSSRAEPAAYDRLSTPQLTAANVQPAASATPPPAPFGHDGIHHERVLATARVLLRASAARMHRTTGQALLASGLRPGTLRRDVRAFQEGVEVALGMAGDGDRALEPEDSVYFHPGPNSEGEAGSVLFVTDEPAALPPRRIPFEGEHPPALAAPPLTSYRAIAAAQPRPFYAPAATNGSASNFFIGVVNAKSWTHAIDLDEPVAPSTATLTVTLEGLTAATHEVRVAIDGQPVGLAVVRGRARHRQSFLVDVERAGATVRRQLVLSTRSAGAESASTGVEPRGAVESVVLIQDARVEYDRRGLAQQGHLRAAVAAGSVLQIDALPSESLVVFDVTDPTVPRWAGVTPVREGPQTVAVAAAADRLGVFEVGAPWAFSQPKHERAPVIPIAIKQIAPADLVIVSPERFASAVERLAEARRQQGLHVLVASIETIGALDGFGHASVGAFRRFLRRLVSSSETRRPAVLLVGRSTFDPDNVVGLAEPSLLPAAFVDTSLLETTADDLLVDLDGDSQPDLSVGRLPARTEAEAATMVAKIAQQIARASDRKRRPTAFLLAGRTDAHGMFTEVVNEFAQRLSRRADVDVAWVGDAVPQDARQRMLAAWAQGPAFVGYAGHGSVGLWNEGLLEFEQARQLPGAAAEVVVSMSCLNGFAHDLYTRSLAEGLLLNPNGGATAVIASSGLTLAGAQATLGAAFIDGLLAGERIGDALRNAKRAVRAEEGDADVLNTFQLFGDPTMRVFEPRDVGTYPPPGPPMPVESPSGPAELTPGAGGCGACSTTRFGSDTSSATACILAIAVLQTLRRRRRTKGC